MATTSTTYNEPVHVARKFASLDNPSGGLSCSSATTHPFACVRRRRVVPTGDTHESQGTFLAGKGKIYTYETIK